MPPFPKTRLVTPEFNSPLTDVIMELQYLRRLQLGGTTPASIFFQLKEFFHLLESIESARIEGNRTTIAEAIEAQLGERKEGDDEWREILNMEEAMKFIESSVSPESPITQGFILELHKMVVSGLSLQREGDVTPGQFRKGNVKIKNAGHVPPEGIALQDYLEEFFSFINAPQDPKLDLLRVAIAHHRFAWIHPFNNGNGRVVRLLTYSMLISRGFNVRTGRLLNPSAVFCKNRGRYYEMLAKADTGEERALIEWCEYVLSGLLIELKKIDKLLDYQFLGTKILKPAAAFSLERRVITELEAKILNVAIEKTIFQASDIKHLTPGKIAPERSRILNRMKNNRLIEPISENARKYVMRFSRSLLSRGLIRALAAEGFITLD